MLNLTTNNMYGIPLSTFSTTRRAFLAAQPPMDTWSSVPADVVSESTEAG